MEVLMNEQEFSDIEIFQHSGKGIPLFMTGHKYCLEADYNNGRRILRVRVTFELMVSQSVLVSNPVWGS
jgi:hypothetical protein